MSVVHLGLIPEFKPGDPAPAGYSERHEWARVQMRAGLTQRQCSACGKWRFAQETCCKAAVKEVEG
jgi:hypothetical protein